MKRITTLSALLFFLTAAISPLRATPLPSEAEYNTLGCSRYEPSYCDFVIFGMAGIGALIPNAFSSQLGPHQPRWTEPSSLDLATRNALVWPVSSMEDAALISDITLYTLISSALWTPFLTGQDYFRSVFLGAEAMLYTVLLTEIFKRSSARLRPYAYFQTRNVDSVNNNLSFFSGHTSTAFAAATTSALLLSEAHPDLAWLIYPTFYLLAATTGYMRIAGDRHYLSDVLMGAATGTAVSLLVYHWRKPWFIVSPTPGGASVTMNRRF